MGGGTETTTVKMPQEQKDMYRQLSEIMRQTGYYQGMTLPTQAQLAVDFMLNTIPQMADYYSTTIPLETQRAKEMAPLTLAAEKARTAYSLPMYQQTYNRMMGYTTPEQQQAAQGSLQQLKEQAGQAGIAPGDPRLLENQRKILEGLTKPDPNVMQTAMQLFGPTATQFNQPNISFQQPGIPSIPEGGGEQTTTTSPGFMGTLTGLGSAGMGLGASAYGIAQLIPLLGLSSKDFKENISKLKSKDYDSALGKVRKTDVNTFRYKGDGASHIGVIAEESPDEITDAQKKMINIPDYLGLLLAATKALDKKVSKMERRNA